MSQDFPQYFINTQLKEPWHLKCEIDTGCKNLTRCEDMVEILEDPQEEQHLKDVYYNLQAIGDWFDIAKSAYVSCPPVFELDCQIRSNDVRSQQLQA